MANPFTSKDGARFTNRSTMMSHEARQKAKAPAAPQSKIGAGSSTGMEDDGMGDDGGDPNDGAAMAAEHGPATALDLQHDHEGGRHTVHAKHADGHEHDTEHGSAAKAHKYAADCAGCGGDEGAGGEAGAF